MKNVNLKFRMLITGSILFLLYSIAALAFMSIYNISIYLISLITILFVILQYIISQKIILKSIKADKISEEYNFIQSFTENYSNDKNFKKPNIYVAKMGTPNAFAFGRKQNGTVVLSKELLEKLNKNEIKAVLAHELAHIENRDSIIMLLGQSISTLFGFAAIILSRRKGAGFITAMIIGQIAQLIVSIVLMAVSRYREYIADETAAEYMNTGEHLSNALTKISSQESKNKDISNEVGALCIVNPGELLSTHPPIEKRIQKLEKYK